MHRQLHGASQLEAQTYLLISQDFTASVVPAPSLPGIPVINTLLEVRTWYVHLWI
jgi:hypothetical protein